MAGLPGMSFKDFAKNPIVALLFVAVIAIGYLYIDNRTTLTNQVKSLQEEVKTLKNDYKDLNNKFIETLSKMK
jgi:uncharacterized membrane protein (DUF106 family)